MKLESAGSDPCGTWDLALRCRWIRRWDRSPPRAGLASQFCPQRSSLAKGAWSEEARCPILRLVDLDKIRDECVGISNGAATQIPGLPTIPQNLLALARSWQYAFKRREAPKAPSARPKPSPQKPLSLHVPLSQIQCVEPVFFWRVVIDFESLTPHLKPRWCACPSYLNPPYIFSLSSARPLLRAPHPSEHARGTRARSCSSNSLHS